MSSIYLDKCVSKIEDEALVRHFSYESEGVEKRELVLSREEFLLCYNNWVKEEQSTENTEKVRYAWKRYTVDMLIDRLEDVKDKSIKIFIKDSKGNLSAVGGVNHSSGITYVFGCTHLEQNTRFDRDKITLSVEQFLQHLYHVQSQSLGNTVVAYSKELITIKSVMIPNDSFVDYVTLWAPDVPDDEVE